MAGEGIEITVQFLDIHFPVHHALGAVHQHRNASLVANSHQLLDGINKP